MRTSSDGQPSEGLSDGTSTRSVELGSLAADSLCVSGNAAPERLGRLLGQAIDYYLGMGRDGPGWGYPQFLPARAGRPKATVAVELEGSAWDEVVAEGERQEVEPERLLEHVALFLAAARDEGRLSPEAATNLSRI